MRSVTALLPSFVVLGLLRALAWWPPLPPTVAGPLLGAVLARLAGMDVVCAAEACGGLLLAIARVTAPAPIDVSPCDVDAEGRCAIIVR